MTTCAICTDEIRGLVRREPLGRNDALVAVCCECSTGKPSARLGPERGYECLETPAVGFSQAVDDAHRRIVPERLRDGLRKGGLELAGKETTPGYVIERVYRKVGGRHISRQELDALVATLPWGKDARFIGARGAWGIYERPDPQYARAARAREVDPLAGLRGSEVDE